MEGSKHKFPFLRGLAEKGREKVQTLGSGGGSWSGQDLQKGKTEYMCGPG